MEGEWRRRGPADLREVDAASIGADRGAILVETNISTIDDHVERIYAEQVRQE
jgi:hypothetical protein